VTEGGGLNLSGEMTMSLEKKKYLIGENIQFTLFLPGLLDDEDINKFRFDIIILLRDMIRFQK